MRDYEMARRRWARVLTLVALAAVGVTLAFASSAAAAAPRPVGPSLRHWSVSKIEQGVGKVTVAQATQRTGDLNRSFGLGPAAFDFAFPGTPGDRATQAVFADATGLRQVLAQAPTLRPDDPRSVKGGAAHLDESQAFQKPDKSRAGASLQIKVRTLLLQTVDANGPLEASDCPGVAQCNPIRTLVRFRVRAFHFAGGSEFFDSGGAVYTEGHQHAWFVGAATLPDSHHAFFPGTEFQVNGDLGANGSGSRSEVRLKNPITVNVPLHTVSDGELFVVRVTLDAEAIDDRGHESAASAFILDPQHVGPVLSARGLVRRGVPMKFKASAVTPRPAARCPNGPRAHAGTVQLSDGAFTVGEGSGTALVLVTRTGGSRGATSAIVHTSGGSALTGSDFKRTRTLVRFEDGDSSPRLVEIPVREDLAAEQPENFTVSLSGLRCAKFGTRRDATVTILDDDQPPVSQPAPAFTVGGSVDGLEGNGLVLVNQGTALQVSANGSFTFPGTFLAGSPYDVRVQAQPTSPDQVCSVVDGTGTVTADVSNVAVHCVRVATPTGLDTNFGAGGRVSTPGSGDARAVLVRPDGRIIAVGSREVGNSFHFEFGASGYDAAGNLDPGFGTGGIATTPLGGSMDKAFDAALLPDGGFVAVGRTDAAGPTNTDFGVARYTADGQPSPAFPAGGFVRTDVAGRGDAANAVAVQPDGKIVAAGVAQTSPIDFDFALVRYNPDGTLDHSFGANGIVTTDLGTLNDVANAVAIQPDGKIVAVGDAEENIGLARYLPNGSLDRTFGGTGTVVSDLGFDDVATGVAITPGGTIFIAGTRLGPHVNLDPYVASYGPNGKLNLGFGQSGVADTDLSGGDDFGDDLVLDSHGGIVVVGTASSPTVTDMALVRYNLDGTLDTFLTTDFHGAGDFGHALAVDPRGGIVAAGTVANGENEFGLIRAFF